MVVHVCGEAVALQDASRARQARRLDVACSLLMERHHGEVRRPWARWWYRVGRRRGYEEWDMARGPAVGMPTQAEAERERDRAAAAAMDGVDRVQEVWRARRVNCWR
jgi:hypothetical protein